MRNLFLTGALTLLALSVVSAEAMPIPPLGAAPAGMTLIAQGCGAGWYRGPYGRCHPMGAPTPYYQPGPVYRPYAYAHPYPHCWWRGGVRVCT